MEIKEITLDQITKSFISAKEQISKVKDIMVRTVTKSDMKIHFLSMGAKMAGRLFFFTKNDSGKLRAQVNNSADAFSHGKLYILGAIVEKMEEQGGVHVEQLLNATCELDARVWDILKIVGVADR